MGSGFDDEDAGRSHRDTIPEGRAPGGRILVADDDDAMRTMVAAALTHEGYVVSEVDSGVELMRVIESSTLDAWPLDGVDLIVSDLRMPGMTGLDVLHKLHATHAATPFILMTAFADPELIALAQRFGVPVLSKPFDLETLTKTAAAMLLVNPSSDVARDSRSGFKWP